jgi:hypothetical protein
MASDRRNLRTVLVSHSPASPTYTQEEWSVVLDGLVETLQRQLLDQVGRVGVVVNDGRLVVMRNSGVPVVVGVGINQEIRAIPAGDRFRGAIVDSVLFCRSDRCLQQLQ